MTEHDLREEIMEIYDTPEPLREAWRAIWRERESRYTVEDAVDALIAAELAPSPYSPLSDRRPDHVPLPSRCYQSEYGFTVHIKGACDC